MDAKPVFSEVYVDPEMVVINKAAGIAFHSDDNQQGIVQRVRQFYQDNSLNPVHRLDKMTSGLMIFARNDQVNRALTALFRDKRLEKYYIALVPSTMKKKQGRIRGDMEKSRQGSWKLCRGLKHPAISYFKSYGLSVDTESSSRQSRRMVVIKPETGKTHQLRVAMKSIGAPIIGDRRYGGETADRGYLHAWKIRFHLDNRLYAFECWPVSGRYFSDSVKEMLQERAGAPEELEWPKGAFLLAGK